jgi:penicillin-binding protein 1A
MPPVYARPRPPGSQQQGPVLVLPDPTLIELRSAPAPAAGPPTTLDNGSNGRPADEPPQRPKVKKFRLFLILCGLSILAVVSTVFGMMMAVAGDLPSLENTSEYQAAQNSVMLDRKAAELARLTGNQNRILLNEAEVSPMLKNAVISVEDERFYDHDGVDYLGIGRALWQDLTAGAAVQGASTITQQFVKNALAAQGDRTVFQKLRESALAYHLEREWTKQKILTQYLNTVYFGNGAYGVESAMRTYFGTRDTTAGEDYEPTERLSSSVEPHQAALLAALIASPAAYDPVQNPEASKQRRDLVLRKMLEQGYVTQQGYAYSIRQPLPSEDEITPPAIDSDQPYFTTWVTQQLVDRFGAGVVFGGGLRIQTTIDLELQDAASQAIDSQLAGVGPTASLVAIDNGTGEVRAMVGGSDFNTQPFNLATNGHRQPGSAIKPFTLIAALKQGISPETTFVSEPKTLPDPDTKGGFQVKNYEGNYSGVITLRDATINSDNSVFAELGVTKVGPKKIAELAARMGIRTPLSTNPAMTLGGLEKGVTPLEMAYAYTTIANRGEKRSGTLATYPGGPVAIENVIEPDGDEEINQPRNVRIYPSAVGDTAIEILTGVVDSGTGTAARVSETTWGKTGTTESYGDAWFCGSDADLTACVWVGYPEGQEPMKTEYGGSPVAGGTYPAQIWADFMTYAVDVQAQKDAARDAKGGGDATGPSTVDEPAPEEQVVEQPVDKAPKENQAEPAPEKQVQEQPAPDQGGGGGGGAPADQVAPPHGGGGDGTVSGGFPG